jgi:hypothetical protein
VVPRSDAPLRRAAGGRERPFARRAADGRRSWLRPTGRGRSRR